MNLTAEFASDASTFLQVVFIDTVPAGDNAVVVAMAAAHVPRQYRRRVIIGGISGALVLRIVLALTATRLLDIVGLTLAGGLRLLWVCWKMLHDVLTAGRLTIRHGSAVRAARAQEESDGPFSRCWSPASRCRSTTSSPLPVQPGTPAASRLGAGPLDRPHGCSSQSHCADPNPTPLDRLGGVGRDLLSGTHDDLGRRAHCCNLMRRQTSQFTADALAACADKRPVPA
jgi:hypothetical protein